MDISIYQRQYRYIHFYKISSLKPPQQRIFLHQLYIIISFLLQNITYNCVPKLIIIYTSIDVSIIYFLVFPSNHFNC